MLDFGADYPMRQFYREAIVMLNRNIPIYEGSQPYLYACYSPEDEMLVLPILTRMYNEGFRIWSASLVDKVSDFVAVRHVSTSACVVMFMSRGMMERINAGIPEVLAACRSSLLRAVILLDDARPNNRVFALTSPEMVEYQRSNDSGFWLYAYSADYLERCRGPWPEVKLEIHQPTFDDIQEEAIAAEYISLENIISRGGVEAESVAPAERYPNNRGYIQPQPDPYTYEPLVKVEAARTVHDRDYDDALALLEQCAEKQIDVIVSHTRPGENTVPAMPSLSPIRPLPDKKAELDFIAAELEKESLPAERPERRVDPEVRTKADMVVEPEETKEEQPAAVKEEIPYIPEPELTVTSIAESIRQIAEASETDSEQITSQEESAESAESVEQIEIDVLVAEGDADAHEEDRSETVSEKFLPTIPSANKSTVQVVVRRQQPAVRVTPVKKRVITETPQSTSRPARNRPVASRSQSLRASEEEKIALEQYIREVAIAAVSTGSEPAEQPVSKRRFGRFSRTAETAAPAQESSAETEITAVSPAETDPVAETSPVQETAAEPAAEKTSPRKSRYPHNSQGLSGLLAMLRRERSLIQNTPVESEEGAAPEVTGFDEPVAEEQLDQNAISPSDNDNAETSVKIIRFSDAVSERKVSDLQEAVNKFMCVENSPESAPVSARVYLRRR